ncbi:hypothetical protein MMJ09_21100, partial [Bacillus vallismortis]|nr:hypothetical protein [Bacillus vallismortis]
FTTPVKKKSIKKTNTLSTSSSLKLEHEVRQNPRLKKTTKKITEPKTTSKINMTHNITRTNVKH